MNFLSIGNQIVNSSLETRNNLSQTISKDPYTKYFYRIFVPPF